MARFGANVSFHGRQYEKVQKLIQEKRLSRICQDAVDAGDLEMLNLVEIQKQLSEEEIIRKESEARTSFLLNRAAKVQEMDAINALNRANEEREQAEKDRIRQAERDEKRKLILQEMQEREEQRTRKEKYTMEREAAMSKMLMTMDRCSTIPEKIRGIVARENLSRYMNNTLDLKQTIIDLCEANGYEFDENKYYETINLSSLPDPLPTPEEEIILESEPVDQEGTETFK